MREFVDRAFREVGISMTWQGSGVEEQGMDAETGKVLVSVDPRYFRPTEVDQLLGDGTRSPQGVTGWGPRCSFSELVRRMVVADLREAEKEHSVNQQDLIDGINQTNSICGWFDRNGRVSHLPTP